VFINEYTYFFRFLEQIIENFFFAMIENYRNLIENSFLMTKMNIGDILHNNLYNMASIIVLHLYKYIY